MTSSQRQAPMGKHPHAGVFVAHPFAPARSGGPLPQFPGIRHILVRHEQAAAHMADGYARASGRMGTCLGTSGPGATNVASAIGIPMRSARSSASAMVALIRVLTRCMGASQSSHEAGGAVPRDGSIAYPDQ